MYHPTPGDVLDPKLKIASLLCNNDVRMDNPASPDNSIIVQGMKEKKTYSLCLSRQIWSRTSGINNHLKER
jgi:hypothetical protein